MSPHILYMNQEAETPLGVLASVAILAMKERWYKYNEERGLFYDYDYISDASESDESESEDDRDDEWPGEEISKY